MGRNTKACDSRLMHGAAGRLLVLSKVADGEVGYGRAWTVQ